MYVSLSGLRKLMRVAWDWGADKHSNPSRIRHDWLPFCLHGPMAVACWFRDSNIGQQHQSSFTSLIINIPTTPCSIVRYLHSQERLFMLSFFSSFFNAATPVNPYPSTHTRSVCKCNATRIKKKERRGEEKERKEESTCSNLLPCAPNGPAIQKFPPFWFLVSFVALVLVCTYNK